MGFTKQKASIVCCAILMVMVGSCGTSPYIKDVAIEYYNIATEYTNLGKADKARQALEKALSLDETLAPAVFNLAVVYLELDNADKAIALLEDLQKKDPQNLQVLNTLAYAHVKAGNEGEAIEIFEAILESSPSNVLALVNFSALLEHQAETERALVLAEKAASTAPEDLHANRRLATILLNLSRVQDALVYFQKCMSLSPSTELIILYLETLFKEKMYGRLIEVVSSLPTDKSKGPVIGMLKTASLILVEGDLVRREAVRLGKLVSDYCSRSDVTAVMIERFAGMLFPAFFPELRAAVQKTGLLTASQLDALYAKLESGGANSQPAATGTPNPSVTPQPVRSSASPASGSPSPAASSSPGR